ncbi:MAG TPA: response regulator [Myxococcales bacterium]|jgi:DNA-binding response OmpR family regulator
MAQRILVVEHHAPTRDLLGEILGQAGYQVLAMAEAARALEAFSCERADALVVAVDLPRLQGSTLGKLLRAQEGGARLPIVAVDRGHLGKAQGVGAILELQANAYVSGANQPKELLAKLAQLLAGAARAPRPLGGIAATLARPPVSSGEMKARTLPSLVVSWHRLARDGVLVIAHHELTRRVFLSGGAPVACDSTSPQDAAARQLAAAGLLTNEQHEKVLDLQRDPQISLRSALVAIGAAVEGEKVTALLQRGAGAQVAQAYGMLEGRFGFYAGTEFAHEVPELPIPALSPLLEGARRSWPARAFVSALAPHLGRFVRRSASFGTDLPALQLSTADLKFALALDGSQTLRQLLSNPGELGHALPLLWFLSLAGAVEHLDEPAGTPGSSPATPGRRKKSLPAETAVQLQSEAVRVMTTSYFGALGLDVTADLEDVEKAWREASSRLHADRFSEYELGPIADLLASVQDKLGAAHRVLSDEKRRKEYVAYLLSRADAPRLAAPHVEAEIALKRGERRMKEGDWSGARQAFEKAVELNPREPEYYGWLAWATFQEGQGPRPERAKVALRHVRKALSLNPTLHRLQVIAAILSAEAGDAAKARGQLLKLLQSTPDSELAKKALQALNRKRS